MLQNDKMRVVVVGGGPAGMMAAAAAAAKGHQVTLVEQNEKLGKKLYLCGKGRCNLTNACELEDFFDQIPHNSTFCYSAVYSFPPQELMHRIESLGVPLKCERGQRVFPVSDKSSDIIKALEKHQVQLMKDTALLDKMYELNLTYFKELSMYILAGKKKLAEVKRTQLADLMSRAQASGLPEDAQAAKDLDEMCIRFEKKIHDLELTRMISIQTAPQIRLVQNNDTMMVEKIQSTIVNTIPLWKSQMVLALGVEHSTQAAEAQRRVTDVTNELLKKNAEKLKIATTETARQSERGIVDMDTLKATNESLISTLDEVMAIQREGREKRQAAEAELRNMEQELKGKLLQLHG